MAHLGNSRHRVATTRRRVDIDRREFLPHDIAPPPPPCQHPTRAELSADYGTYINSGQMPQRLITAKCCGTCWYTVALVMRRS